MVEFQSSVVVLAEQDSAFIHKLHIYSYGTIHSGVTAGMCQYLKEETSHSLAGTTKFD
jgi:hypothetical protein